MAFNGSGVWIAPTGQPVVSGTVIQSATFNSLVSDIAASFNNVVTRDGQGVMSGPFKLQAGTVTIPGLSFNAESSTGLWWPSTGVLSTTVSGVEVMRLKSNGAVLVDTTTDDGTNKLQVNGGVAATVFNGPLIGNVTGTVTGHASLDLPLTGGTLTGPLVGQGASFSSLGVAPASGTAVMAISRASQGTGQTALNFVGGTGSNTWQILQPGGSNDLKFYNNGGVGDVLLLSATTGVAQHYYNVLAPNLYVGSGTAADIGTLGLPALLGGGIIVSGNSNSAVGNAGGLNFQTANTERMRIDSSGNIGIGGGAASAGVKVQILGTSSTLLALGTNTGNGSTNFWPFAVGDGASGGGGTNQTFVRIGRFASGTAGMDAFQGGVGNAALSLGTYGTERFFIASDGRVGIGASPSTAGVPLQVTGSGSYVELNTTTNGYTAVFGKDNGTLRWMIGQSAYGNAEGLSIYTGTGQTERARFDSNGNLLITTTVGNSPTTATMLCPAANQTGTTFVKVAAFGTAGTSGTSYGGQWRWMHSEANGSVYKDGFRLALRTYDNGLGTESGNLLTISGAGVITDVNGFELGYKSVPPDTSVANGGALTAAQRGRSVVGAYSSVVVNPGVFARGDVVSFYQDSASSTTIVQGSGFTLRLAGTSTTGTRTLAARGIATLYFNSSSEAILSGNVS